VGSIGAKSIVNWNRILKAISVRSVRYRMGHVCSHRHKIFLFWNYEDHGCYLLP